MSLMTLPFHSTASVEHGLGVIDPHGDLARELLDRLTSPRNIKEAIELAQSFKERR